MKPGSRTYAATALTLFATLIMSLATATLAQEMPGKGLVTQWAKDVSPINPLPEYPRPGMARTKWFNLNGPWDYAISEESASAIPPAFDGKILVPYPYESTLSGIRKMLPASQQALVPPHVQRSRRLVGIECAFEFRRGELARNRLSQRPANRRPQRRLRWLQRGSHFDPQGGG